MRDGNYTVNATMGKYFYFDIATSKFTRPHAKCFRDLIPRTCKSAKNEQSRRVLSGESRCRTDGDK